MQIQIVQADFDARAKEVEEYFDFVKTLLSADSELSYTDKDGKPCAFSLTADLPKTLKANGFLLVYNLVESTMKNAIETIILHLSSQGVSFDDLSSNVKIVILKNTKRLSPETLEPLFNQIGQDIIRETFKKDKLFSGNLDAREIRRTMDTFGIAKRHRINGNCLLTIKEQRNYLAHGTVSFAECGKDYDITDLIKFKVEAQKYLQATLEDIEQFLINGDYKK